MKSGVAVAVPESEISFDEYRDAIGVRGWEASFDLSGVSTLKVDTKKGEPTGYELYVYVGGSQVFSTISQHGWKTRSLDVSGYSGQNTVRLELNAYNIYDDLVSSGTGNGRALKFYCNGYRDSYYAVFMNLVFKVKYGRFFIQRKKR